MMHVVIHDGDAREAAGAGVRGRDRNVVEKTESHGPVPAPA